MAIFSARPDTSPSPHSSSRVREDSADTRAFCTGVNTPYPKLPLQRATSRSCPILRWSHSVITSQPELCLSSSVSCPLAATNWLNAHSNSPMALLTSTSATDGFSRFSAATLVGRSTCRRSSHAVLKEASRSVATATVTRREPVRVFFSWVNIV